MYGENIDILDSFKYLGSVVHNNSGSHQKGLLWWIGPRCYGLTQYEYLTLSVSAQMDKEQMTIFLALWIDRKEKGGSSVDRKKWKKGELP